MKPSVDYKHLAIVIAATVLPLLPFLDKAFHIDSPLFLWTSKQILKEPWDFYGFTGNWFGLTDPAHVFIKNPPLAGYYIALVALIAGFDEIYLHMAFLVPAVAAALGTYMLALRLTERPLAAALVTVASPAFLVTSTSVMCDVMMLSFWVWAVLFWMKGLDEDRPFYLALGACLVALASLTKYFGMSLIPLLALYSVLKGRRGIRSCLFLLIPIAVLAGYQFYTEALYGRGLLLDASSYATGFREKTGAGLIENAFVGIVFSGGALIAAIFFLPPVWGLKAVIMASGAAYAWWKGDFGAIDIFSFGFTWGYLAQLALYWAAGAGIVALAVHDLMKRRGAESALLALWVFGTLFFAVYVNWTINARSLLPMVPAAAILMLRAVEGAGPWAKRLYIPVAISFVLSFCVAWADFSHAQSARAAASEISARFQEDGRTLWFRGHWGFQYYMEGLGARPFDFEARISPGEFIIVPDNNTGKKRLSESFHLVDEIRVPPRLLSAMNHDCGAGFHSNIWGPLPFVFHPDCDEGYRIYMKASP